MASDPKLELKFRWHKAITRSMLKPTTKLVAYALWEHTNKYGGNAHPGNALLAEETRTSVPTIKRHLKALRDGGWVVKTSTSNDAPDRRFADVYALAVPGTTGDHLFDPRSSHSRHPRETLAGVSTGDQIASTGDQITQTGDHPSDPPTSLYNNPLHHSAPSGAGPVPPDHTANLDVVEEWLNKSLGGLDLGEATTAWQMWESGSHPKAIKNKILSDRMRPATEVSSSGDEYHGKVIEGVPS